MRDTTKGREEGTKEEKRKEGRVLKTIGFNVFQMRFDSLALVNETCQTVPILFLFCHK